MCVRAEGEGHRQLVGADRGRGVAVIATPELAAQPVVDDRAKPLQSVQNLSGCVAALAAQCDARAVPRPRGLRWGRVRMLRKSGRIAILLLPP
jgi:hypothetical protein